MYALLVGSTSSIKNSTTENPMIAFLVLERRIGKVYIIKILDQKTGEVHRTVDHG